MAFDYRFPTLSTLAFLLAAPAAQAELTSSEVWSDWKEYMSSLGYDMVGVESTNSQGLTIEGMKMNVDLPQGEGQFEIDMGTMQFIDQADGSVRIDMSEVWRFGFNVTSIDAEDVSGQVLYTHKGTDLVVSGDPSQLKYEFKADSIEFKLDDLTIDGAPVGSDLFAMTIAMSDAASTTDMTIGDTRSYTQSMSIAATTYDINFKEPEGSALFDMQGAINSLKFAGDSVIPLVADFEDMPNLLKAGFAFAGGYSYAGGSAAISFDGPDGSGTMNTTSEGGAFDMNMSEAGLTYVTSADAITVNALMNEFPIPISFEADRATFKFGIPMVKSDDPQDFAFGTSFEGFQMSDTIWGLFDPASQLPRDPATVILDLKGKAKVLFDFLDPAQASIIEESGEVPGELNALDVTNVTVDAVGARLTGSGAFTFDNSDTETFDGLPKPLGAIDFQLLGANGLIDKLTGMGLLPQEQATGARLMLGLFASPGEGEDSLVSKIEINEEGHVLANGQRLQ
ncbi:MAG: DUF2125 domain-containing protein [Paracoccaceae bacterium]